VKPLDPLTVPLRGLHLIEASAGTGKTYTIAAVYLRLLLDGLSPDRILVVTYTNAATEELRGRIRRRLTEALSYLDGVDGGGESTDALLRGICDGVDDPVAGRALLLEAVTRMDEAAVYTIHGFCQRALQEHAFESGMPFEADLLTEELSLRHRVIEDFWRRRVAAMETEEAAWVRGLWPDPAALLAAISTGLSRDGLRLLPEDTAGALEGARLRLAQLSERLRALWSGERTQLVSLLETSKSLNRQSYNRKIVARIIAQMDGLMGQVGPITELPADFQRLTPGMLAERTKAGREPPQHPFFFLCGELESMPGRVERLRRAEFLAEALHDCRKALERRKEETRQLFFDDLLRRLGHALDGEGGEVLAARLRARRPVALIDEFQDTDPLQYRIFKRIYAARPESGLYFIGDPKQAIYAFRGADVFTYIRARRETASLGARYTLGLNWRSAPRLVRTINRLFERSTAPFVYDRDIPFRGVEPAPGTDRTALKIRGVSPEPMWIWLLSHADGARGRLTKADADAQAAAGCAARIAELLALGERGKASIGGRAVAARDIAVLVRTHREGDSVQAALRREGVASVSLSHDSVFATEEAGGLAQLLEALADGADEGLIRGAAASRLLGYRVSDLEALNPDETAWEALVDRFQGYRERWRERGFMSALQDLIHREEVAARLLAWPDGERRLTNLLQLAELLQVAEEEHPGPDALRRWLADRRAESPTGDESSQLRLESDEDLVHIVTMHRSKGLEFPIVLLPFPWSVGRPHPGPVLFHDPERLTACLDLGSAELSTHRRLAEREELAQMLRLFYVAVTRAKHLCCLCWGLINRAEDSALAWLLHPDVAAPEPASRMKALDDAGLRADLEAFADDARAHGGGVLIQDLNRAGPRLSPPRAGRTEGLSAAVMARRISRDWRVASYSWLANGAESDRPDYDQQIDEPSPQPAQPETEAVDEVFDFPRGTRAGHFLHAFFERLDFEAATGEDMRETAIELLGRYGLETRWESVVSRLGERVLETPLNAAGLRLRSIGRRHRLDELEFHFPLAALGPADLQGALAPFPPYRDAAHGLAFDGVRGLMKGFIDLVFREGGRWYVVDYKSNHLGNRLADYSPAGLRHAMRRHRYDLQYLIYTLALHRYLRLRQPRYGYDTHFGGVYYLFLRGMRPRHGPAFGVYADRPDKGAVEALDALFGAGQPARGGD
jgi:exodeoxyribonuclease V beta subunit